MRLHESSTCIYMSRRGCLDPTDGGWLRIPMLDERAAFACVLMPHGSAGGTALGTGWEFGRPADPCPATPVRGLGDRRAGVQRGEPNRSHSGEDAHISQRAAVQR